MTVRQNIGIILRHLYVVDSYMQEEIHSQYWQMFHCHQEVQDVRDLEPNCEIILQQRIIDIPNHVQIFHPADDYALSDETPYTDRSSISAS